MSKQYVKSNAKNRLISRVEALEAQAGINVGPRTKEEQESIDKEKDFEGPGLSFYVNRIAYKRELITESETIEITLYATVIKGTDPDECFQYLTQKGEEYTELIKNSNAPG